MTDTIYFDQGLRRMAREMPGRGGGRPGGGHQEAHPLRGFPGDDPPGSANDDLDLQLLWLEVLQKKGRQVTAADLAEAWDRQCWYPFNEYGIF